MKICEIINIINRSKLLQRAERIFPQHRPPNPHVIGNVGGYALNVGEREAARVRATVRAASIFAPKKLA